MNKLSVIFKCVTGIKLSGFESKVETQKVSIDNEKMLKHFIVNYKFLGFETVECTHCEHILPKKTDAKYKYTVESINLELKQNSISKMTEAQKIEALEAKNAELAAKLESLTALMTPKDSKSEKEDVIAEIEALNEQGFNIEYKKSQGVETFKEILAQAKNK